MKRRARKRPTKKATATPVDPYKVFVVVVALAPAFATEFFRETATIPLSPDRRWESFEHMASGMIAMAKTIARRLP